MNLSASLDFTCHSLHSVHLYLSFTPILRSSMSDSVHVGMTQETDIDTDQDLRDVFRLMYDQEDDWAFDEVRQVLSIMVMMADRIGRTSAFGYTSPGSRAAPSRHGYGRGSISHANI